MSESSITYNKDNNPIMEEDENWVLCEPVADYCQHTVPRFQQLDLFTPTGKQTKQ